MKYDLEDLGGDEIADDFNVALADTIESGQKTILAYDLDKGVYIKITVEPLTEQEFDAIEEEP